MIVNQFLVLAAVLFSLGIYGVLVRRNAVLVLLSVELMLTGVNINLGRLRLVPRPDGGPGLRTLRDHGGRRRGGNRAGDHRPHLPQPAVGQTSTSLDLMKW